MSTATPTPPAPAPAASAADARPAPGAGPTVLFAVELRTPLDAAAVARLSRELGMSTAPDPKVPCVPRGVARLDFESGLFLVEAGDGVWRLECRTWGRPPAEAVRAWAIQALHVARGLDPGATLTETA